MFIDARVLSEDTVIETDVCIVGAGAAGITLAREWINQPFQVCLLESGGLEPNKLTQSLYVGNNVGETYYPLGEARARFLGGSTNLWGGWSRPMDEIDFEDRPWMPHSGWAIAKSELDPYYERAQKACKLGPYEYEYAYWEEALTEWQRQQFPFPGDMDEKLVRHIWQVIPASHLRFGEAYRTEIERARNINTYLYTNVIEIESNDNARTVTRLRAATLEGNKFWIAAKVFILASGGIENPRLLLASNQVQTAGLGNQHDLVGRFFMEHLMLRSGKLRLSKPVAQTQTDFQIQDTYIAARGLGLSKAVQQQEQILNFSLRLGRLMEDWQEALKHMKYRMRQLKKAEDWTTIIEGHKYQIWQKTPVIEDLMTLLVNFDRIAAKIYSKIGKKDFQPAQSDCYTTYLISEQAPNPDSRVTLSKERDRLGVNCVQLDWRLLPIDKFTITRSLEIIGEQLKASGLGEFHNELADDETCWRSMFGSYHHIGTTRMSANPKDGVVDEHCQVHGINNLYVAGSSVFPTSGLSNPTLTIVALAIRLADRIKADMAYTSATTRQLETTSA